VKTQQFWLSFRALPQMGVVPPIREHTVHSG